VSLGDEPTPKQNYRDLRVWQAAIDLVTKIYEVTRALPNEERYALGDQMRRAAVSIPANIAEGQARRHSKEFLQHLSIAKGSLAELHTLLTVAERLKYLSADQLARLEDDLSGIRRPLEGLMSRLRNPA
jgi:four helix bundle protein